MLGVGLWWRSKGRGVLVVQRKGRDHTVCCSCGALTCHWQTVDSMLLYTYTANGTTSSLLHPCMCQLWSDACVETE
jgi:hypothetical protein